MELDYEKLNDFAGALQSFATIISFIIGGIWIYRKYINQQEKYPNIEFSADVKYIGTQKEWTIVELIGEIENKGKVQLKMKKFEFDLNALFDGDEVVIKDEWGGQVHFPNLLTKGSFLPKDWDYFFIDPAIKAKYSFVTRVPKETNILIFHCWFEYFDKRNFGHTAEKSISVSKLKESEVAESNNNNRSSIK